MAQIPCPRCGQMVEEGGIPAWEIVVSICLFPLGLLALLAGKDPTICPSCGYNSSSPSTAATSQGPVHQHENKEEAFAGKGVAGPSTAADYYVLLGIPRSASQEEIAKAFHRIADIYHPDRLGDNASATERKAWEMHFMLFKEAYLCLANPVTRSQYDVTQVYVVKKTADPDAWKPYLIDLLKARVHGNLAEHLNALRQSSLPSKVRPEDYAFLMIMGYTPLKEPKWCALFVQHITKQQFDEHIEMMGDLVKDTFGALPEKTKLQMKTLYDRYCNLPYEAESYRYTASEQLVLMSTGKRSSAPAANSPAAKPVTDSPAAKPVAEDAAPQKQ